MSGQLILHETDGRPALLKYTCYLVWLGVGPIILLLLLLLAGVNPFAGVTNLTVGLPLPIGLIPLLLVLLSTAGLWRQNRWGVLLFGTAGLLGIAVMLFHPDAKPVFAGNGLSEALAWISIGILQVIYTWRLWTQMPTWRT